MEIRASVDPAVLWLRARQFCYLGGHAAQSGEIIENPKSKGDMPADLADSLKADEEDRETDYAPTRQIGGHADGEDRDELPAGRPRCRGGRHEGRSHRDGKHTFQVTRRPSGGAPEEQSRGIQDQIVAGHLHSRRGGFLWPCDSTDGCAQKRGCGWLARAQATARDVPTQKSTHWTEKRRPLSGPWSLAQPGVRISLAMS